MRGRGSWTVILLAALAGACGDEGGTPDGGLGDAGAVDGGMSDGGTADGGPPDAGAADAGPLDGGHAVDAGSPDAGGGTDVTVEVVAQDPFWYDFAPLEDARVRVDGADGSSAEGRTDASGLAIVPMPEGSGPWTVTAAHPGHNAVSLVGVDGPIEGALHVRPIGSISVPATRAVTGMIMGEASGSTVQVMGPGVSLFTPGLSGDYTLDVFDRPGAGVARVMAVEWMDLDSPPSNAVWLDIELGASDLSGNNIVFPSPARTVATSSMTLEVPTSGAVDASTFTPAADINAVFLMQDGYRYRVGSVTAASTTPGSFDLEVNALTGDMAPTHIYVWLSDGGEWTVIVSAPFADESTFTVPAAVTVEAAGSNLGDVRLTVDAPAYAHVGASISPGWFVYAFRSGPFVDQPWPELPSGITMADIGIVSTSSSNVNVFATSPHDGVPIWEGSRITTTRGIVRSVPIALTGR